MTDYKARINNLYNVLKDLRLQAIQKYNPQKDEGCLIGVTIKGQNIPIWLDPLEFNTTDISLFWYWNPSLRYYIQTSSYFGEKISFIRESREIDWDNPYHREEAVF